MALFSKLNEKISIQNVKSETNLISENELIFGNIIEMSNEILEADANAIADRTIANLQKKADKVEEDTQKKIAMIQAQSQQKINSIEQQQARVKNQAQMMEPQNTNQEVK